MKVETLAPWQIAWRVGIAPHLSQAGLQALAAALKADDSRLRQGRVVSPPLYAGEDMPPAAACAIGFAGWQGDGRQTVGAVEEYFDQTSVAAEKALAGQLETVCDFVEWFDATPRATMRPQLLREVARELRRRAGVLAAS